MNKILPNLNHSAAHVLAQAILELYPFAKLTIGPAIEEGFYYDIDFGSEFTFSTKDFNKVKKQMQKIINNNLAFTTATKSKQELLAYYQNNPFKTELINNLNQEELQVVYTGDKFFDLCKGGHVASTKEIKAFDLLKISSAYWRGDAKNPSLTRIYGVAFSNQEDLAEHLQVLEYRRKYDHRNFGSDLCLFSFDPLIGPGLPLWLENGYITKKIITNFINDIQAKHNVDFVSTPVLGSKELYETSGHWAHYRENMFPSMVYDEKEYVLRPMTCPHHITLFQQHAWSYKQLPKIYGENALLYRYESSGSLTGLERVRSMELIDNHAFCTHEQINEVIEKMYSMIKTAAIGFGIKFSRIDLSLHDPNAPEKFYNDPQMWKNSESQLKAILDHLKIDYQPYVGEAAFYGPKIDFQMETITKKIVTIATIQLDFLLPQKFQLKYKDNNGEFQTPVMVHVGIIGTLERFFALLLEQYKGVLPFWLAPVQMVLIPVNHDKHLAYCQELMQQFQNVNLRVKLDDSPERLGKKIRNAQTHKIPYQIVIGDEELNDLTQINYREYGQENNIKISKEKLIELLVAKNKIPSTKV